MSYDDEPEPRFKEGRTVRLMHDTEEEYTFEQQNNEDGPQNGETITGETVTPQDLLTVVSIDWDHGGYVYNLESQTDPEWRVWNVPEDDLRSI